jgi:two-component system nitrate/nitrite response regulator NarL
MSEVRTEGSPDSQQRNGIGGPRAVRVIIADSQAIYRVGLRKVLAVEDDIRVVAQAENLPQVLAAVKKNPADVLIFESQLCPNAAEAATEILQLAPALKIILLTSDPDEQATVEYLRRARRPPP